MDRDKMKQIVKEHIFCSNGVSYVELERLFDENKYDYRGNFDHIASENEHVVFWMGWSEDAINILHELYEEQLIHKEPVNFLNYILDGKTLRLPIVRRPRQYKTDHWLPVLYFKWPEQQRGQGR